jgi:hypothetical protein
VRLNPIDAKVRDVSQAHRSASLKGVYSISPRGRASTPLCLRGLWASGALQTPISGLPEIGAQMRAGRINPTCVDRHAHHLRDTRWLILAPMGSGPRVTNADQAESNDNSYPIGHARSRGGGWIGQGRRRRVEQAGQELRKACAERFGNDEGAVEIGHGRQHAAGIVVEQPERGVALVAQEPAHLSRRVAMIDAKRAPGRLFADGADAVLLLDQPPVLLGGGP